MTFYVRVGDDIIQVKLNYEIKDIKDPTEPQELTDEIEKLVGGEVIGYTIKFGNSYNHYLFEDDRWINASGEELLEELNDKDITDPTDLTDNNYVGTWDGEDVQLQLEDEGDGGGKGQGKGQKAAAMSETKTPIESDDSQSSNEPEPEKELVKSDEEDVDSGESKVIKDTNLELEEPEEQADSEGHEQFDESDELEEPEPQDLELIPDTLQELEESVEQVMEADESQVQLMETEDADLFLEEELVVFKFEDFMHWSDMIANDGASLPNEDAGDWTQGTEGEEGSGPDYFDEGFSENFHSADEDVDDQVEW